jgi:hypothetical protein
VAIVILASGLFAAQQTSGDKEVWGLEDNYWQFVKTNDMVLIHGLLVENSNESLRVPLNQTIILNSSDGIAKDLNARP